MQELHDVEPACASFNSGHTLLWPTELAGQRCLSELRLLPASTEPLNELPVLG